jgi:ribose transport system permease protein
MLIRNGGVSTRFATFLETDILTALVLGGMPLTGGSGAKMKSIIIGAFTIMALKNGLLLIGASDKILQLLMGVLFLISVAISFDRKNTVVIK